MSHQKSNKGALWDKSLAFAIAIADFCEALSENRHNWRLCDQLLRSGTSIGANIREASSAESNADFLHKYLIALKECRETQYWLDVLSGSKRITATQFSKYSKLAKELDTMLSAAAMTLKTKLGRAQR